MSELVVVKVSGDIELKDCVETTCFSALHLHSLVSPLTLNPSFMNVVLLSRVSQMFAFPIIVGFLSPTTHKTCSDVRLENTSPGRSVSLLSFSNLWH